MNRMMRLRSVAIASSISVLLLVDLSSLRLDFYSKKAIAISQQTQQTTINLDANELKQPQMLSISSSQALTQITGDIKVNGKSIKKLSRNSTQINLAPSLKLGRNVVVVSGRYSPASTSVKFEFVTPNNRVSQQVAGSGRINQVLVIKVQ
jgi:hypothetical protein